MRPIWILGAGRFGLKAARWLGDVRPPFEYRIIDADQQACRRARKSGFPAICQDGIEFLCQHLHRPDDAEWIIPAIPLHVAYQWVRRRLPPGCAIEKCDLPDGLIERLPHPIEAKNATVYTSIASFICPEDCPEPPDMCWMTREPRPCRVD